MRRPGAVILVASWLALATVSGLDLKKSMETARMLLPSLCYMNEKSEEDPACSRCVAGVRELLSALGRTEEWAILMLDALVKPPPGIFGGAFTFMSDFDACLKVPRANVTDGHLKKIDADVLEPRYCSIKISIVQPPENDSHPEEAHTGIMALLDKEKENLKDVSQLLEEFPGFLGLCLPSPCTSENLRAVGRALKFGMGHFLEKPPKVNVDMEVVDCVTKEDTTRREVTLTLLATLVVVGLLAILIVFGTILDAIFILCSDRDHEDEELDASTYKHIHAYQLKSQSTACEVLRSFSAYRNLRLLMRGRGPPGSLRPVCGITSLSLIWIVLGNSLTLRGFNVTMNMKELKHALENPVIQFAVNSSLAIDALMTVLGIAIAYNIVRHLRAKFVIDNCGIMDFLRAYLSATKWFSAGVLPSYMLLLLILNAIFPKLSSGPTWPIESKRFLSQCPNHWIWNIAFINNFFPTSQQCMPHTWMMAYLAQAILFAGFMMLVLTKYPKCATLALGLCIAGTILSTFIINLLNNIGPTALLREYRPGSRTEYHDLVATNLYTRGSPICVGIITGYFLGMKPKLHCPKLAYYVGWILSLILLLGTINGTYFWNKGPIPPGSTDYAAYDAFHRLLFSAGLSFLAVACIRGHGGVINVLLCWPGWQVITRLTYIIYIINPFLIVFTNGTTKAPVYYTMKVAVQEVLWNLLATILISIPCHLLLEAPFLRLVDLFASAREKDEEEDSSADINIPLEQKKFSPSYG
ncbi:nose resistant to fluoxetine protein 6-like [Ornithodoros turicata]|uniref:nose resistant to fluoxetine protein 6-like n=1 Tax=Ornithodoros turicata TaxID=34597 RepID=UPI0031387ABF